MFIFIYIVYLIIICSLPKRAFVWIFIGIFIWPHGMYLVHANACCAPQPKCLGKKKCGTFCKRNNLNVTVNTAKYQWPITLVILSQVLNMNLKYQVSSIYPLLILVYHGISWNIMDISSFSLSKKPFSWGSPIFHDMEPQPGLWVLLVSEKSVSLVAMNHGDMSLRYTAYTYSYNILYIYIYIYIYIILYI